MTTFTVTNLNDSGAGSLRQAILDTNNQAGADIITFHSSLKGQRIVLEGTELTISDDLTIDGDIDNDGIADITVDANQRSRVFTVSDANYLNRKTVALDGLIIQNGDVADSGGGVYNWENLTLSNSTLRNNTALGQGGGLFTQAGDTVINNSTLENNSGSSQYGAGGGIYAYANTLEINDSVIRNNIATGSGSDGGGIAGVLSTMTINNTIISDNDAAGDGGGIFSGDSQLTIKQSTFSGNNTAGFGGAIYNYKKGQPSSFLSLSDSSLTQNTAGISGGAIASLEVSSRIAGSNTITNNSAPVNPDLAGNSYSIFGTSGRDTLIGGDGNDWIFGGIKGDYLSGLDGDDELLGDNGRDTLLGGAGNDLLNGGNGVDILTGGSGDDTLTGGLKKDTFVFDSGFDDDVITDFNQSEGDKIDLSDFGLLGMSDLNISYNNGQSYHVITSDAAGFDQISVAASGISTFVAEDFVF